MPELQILNAEQLCSCYLEAVQRLTVELASAMAAVARNNIGSLENHVQNQLALCARIQDLEHYFRKSPPGDKPAAAFRQELDAAIQDLKQAKRAYAMVIAKSSRSQKMFLALYAARRESQPGALEPCETRGTLSCEI